MAKTFRGFHHTEPQYYWFPKIIITAHPLCILCEWKENVNSS
uniref:Uncharacterized protein n=1 Tax=Rhizophora mucronata TaxID=61149 RepID=A0A2P2NTG6_RHIMU